MTPEELRSAESITTLRAWPHPNEQNAIRKLLAERAALVAACEAALADLIPDGRGDDYLATVLRAAIERART